MNSEKTAGNKPMDEYLKLKRNFAIFGLIAGVIVSMLLWKATGDHSSVPAHRQVRQVSGGVQIQEKLVVLEKGQKSEVFDLVSDPRLVRFTWVLKTPGVPLVVYRNGRRDFTELPIEDAEWRPTEAEKARSFQFEMAPDSATNRATLLVFFHRK